MAREIDIGLVLGGTVSAGAYTAGVVDFLLEALTAFEAKRTSGDADAPTHRPILKAASGSSGGGICAALLAVAATKRITHMKSPTQAIGSFENPLYNLWTVDSLNVAAFVDSGDLDRADGPADRPLSILNGDILEIVSDLAFVTSNAPTNYTFFADPFAVNLATTNLRGVPYSIPFITDKAAGDPGIDRHGMRMHADHLRFAWSPTGKTLPATIPLDPAKFPQSISDIPTAPGWHDLRQAAQATSAFPLVFPARRVEKPRSRYNAHLGNAGGNLAPDWPAGHPAKHAFYAVDAGTVNNEPLELTRAALVGPRGHFAAVPEDIDKVVLLIDPLNGGGLAEPSPQFFELFGQLLGTWIQQSRFKPEEFWRRATNRSSRASCSRPRASTRAAPRSPRPSPPTHSRGSSASSTPHSAGTTSSSGAGTPGASCASISSCPPPTPPSPAGPMPGSTWIRPPTAPRSHAGPSSRCTARRRPSPCATPGQACRTTSSTPICGARPKTASASSASASPAAGRTIRTSRSPSSCPR